MEKEILNGSWFLNIANEQVLLLFIAAFVAVILIGVLAYQMKKRNKGGP